MLLLGLLAILGYPWEWVSHFPMRYAGLESGPEDLKNSWSFGLFRVWFFSGTTSTSCHLQAQGKVAGSNHLLEPQLPLEEKNPKCKTLLSCICRQICLTLFTTPNYLVVWNKNYPSSSWAMQNLSDYSGTLFHVFVPTAHLLHWAVGPANLMHVQLVWEPDNLLWWALCHHPSWQKWDTVPLCGWKVSQTMLCCHTEKPFWADFPGSY